ncbi:preprotein translocase subunit YajC [Anaerocolumna sp.]|uniref:preprotein translocase subunit YajC n=1 Tax=Anaerocolumna sp. TaxID=2041569 RepID=UPI0028A84D7A|nr:preprotein translocase subunit YajC [Anaerocolumna sp.]
MNNLLFLTEGAAVAGSPWMMLIWVAAMGALIYFMTIRPQKKQQKEHMALLSTIQDGDSVLTSSGFYGVVIDVMDEVVIVEFGNNKNCRIPMKKAAIVEVEKSATAEKSDKE